jgi:hypothetical protein
LLDAAWKNGGFWIRIVSLAEEGRFSAPMMAVDVGDFGNADIAFGRERVERS